MSRHERFHYTSLAELKQDVARLGLNLPFDGNFRVLAEPVRLGKLSTPNRFAIHPMEGFDADSLGTPQDLTFRRYRRYAAGGAGLIWFEATAVLPEARSNPQQLWIHEKNVSEYAKLVAETRRAARDALGREPVLILQLTHSGRYSKPSGIPAPLIAHHSPILDPAHQLPPDYPLISDSELEALQDSFLAAAALAAKAGFDGVDIKSCHRYLVSELLASHTREGKYGGSFENRTRFLREVFERVRQAQPDLLATARMNVYDAIPYPYGFGVSHDDARVPDLSEPKELMRALRELGAAVLNVSIGNPYFNPHVGRPYDFPIKGMNPPEEHPLEGIARFLGITRDLQMSLPALPLLGSGYSWLRQFMPMVAAGAINAGWATLIGQGRGAFAYPDSVTDILEKGGMDPGKCCVSCSACTQIMRDGGRTGCVVRDSAVYGPEYRKARRFAPDRLKAEAQRCRDCAEPTCQGACPAHVNVPGFIKAYASGDYRKAYEILREANALPELCAQVCPVEEQCEGACIEGIFCRDPIAICDIQLQVCRIARDAGWIGVKLPEEPRAQAVAVIGAGPAGLACAIRLLEQGFKVRLFEKDSEIGGTPDRAIPKARFEDASSEIGAILAPALKTGRLEIETGRGLGAGLSLEELRKSHDAVFLAPGLPGALSLGQATGVYDALSFLKQAKQGAIASLAGKRVAVLGGGNTAMDAAATAQRFGAQDVYLLYRRSFAELPAWPAERDTALAIGVHIMVLTQPLGYEANAAGELKGVRIARTELGEPDKSGRRKPVPVPESEGVLAVDMAIEAIGQQPSDELRKALKDVPFTSGGLVKADPYTQATDLPGIFAGGDVVNGGSTAVRCVAEGMRAARSIADFFERKTPDE